MRPPSYQHFLCDYQPMNYRHSYHAGNFADLMKHAVLVTLLGALSQKDKPWRYYDTHAGAGLYDTRAEMAVRTRESESGIGRLWHAKGNPPEPVATLRRIVAAANPELAPEGTPRYYPGSPVVAAALAREHDRLVLAELHPEEAARLRLQFRNDRRAAVHERDGYEMLKALVPPPERRGLVLMDPPFEREDEFTLLAETVLAAQARWPDGIYALWYPLKDTAPVRRLHRQLQQSSRRPVLQLQLQVAPPSGETLTASGMTILNPPWRSDQRIAESLAYLARVLAPGQGEAAVSWLLEE